LAGVDVNGETKKGLHAAIVYFKNFLYLVAEDVTLLVFTPFGRLGLRGHD